MSEYGRSRDLVQRWVSGDETAAAEIDGRYRETLCTLVEREMDRCLRAREDAEDVVQSALETFFRRAAKGAYEFKRSGDVWRLLATITRNKIRSHAEHHKAKKRTPKAEVRLDSGSLLAEGPAAAETALLDHVLESVLVEVKSPDSEILQLRLQGYSMAKILSTALAGLKPPDPAVFILWLQGAHKTDIAKRLDCTYAKVRCKIDRILGRLRRLAKAASCS